MTQKHIFYIIVLIVFIISALVCAQYFLSQKDDPYKTPTPVPNTPITQSPIETHANLIRVTKPQLNEKVSSPLIVEGEARGTWFFEASFPVKIFDENNNLLGSTPAQAQSEWMTTEFVPFQAKLELQTPTTKKGFLILEKDNPSGLPEHDDEISLPIEFE